MAAKEHIQCLYDLLDYIDNNYHLDHVIRIRTDDVIMQYQDGRQRTPHETLVRPQRPQ